MWSKPSQYDVMKYLDIVCDGEIFGGGRENIVFTVLLGGWILAILTISVCTTAQGTQCEWFHL